MSETRRGRLVRTETGRWLIDEGAGAKPRRVRDRLPDGLAEGDEVDYEWHRGEARGVRAAGRPAPPRLRPQVTSEGDGGRTRRRPAPATSEFLNPYNFVPALPRATDGPLADRLPDGHDRLLAGRWTGTVALRLTTVTPLLLVDPARTRTDDHDHKWDTVPTDEDGAPLVDPASIKGMLRSAFEAVTNSRLGVFDGHDGRLGYRMAAREGLRMIPARVSDDGTHLDLLPGATRPGHQGREQPLHAAWLPTYRHAVRYPDGSEPGHGDEVSCWIEQMQHHRWDGKRNEHVRDFRFWRVRTIAPRGQLPGQPPEPSQRPRPSEGRGWSVPVPDKAMEEIDGYVFRTNQNISRKHDERVFFHDPGVQVNRVDLTDAAGRQLCSDYEDVICDYRVSHDQEKEIKGRKDKERGGIAPPSKYLGPNPGDTAWSPHQYEDDRAEVAPGLLCYAEWDPDARRVVGLFPVTIARRVHERSPADLVPRDLRPARRFSELSPADRVFGWAHPKGHGAYRGQLAPGPVICEGGAGAIEWLGTGEPGDDWLPLSILGEPKPKQSRFYVGAGAKEAAPLPEGSKKADHYEGDRTLRGRKVYYHHAGLSENHWDPDWGGSSTETPASRSGRYQEFRRPRKARKDGRGRGLLTGDHRGWQTEEAEERDSQNRSIRGWVRPGQTFRVELDVVNLTDVELGALLWLCSMNEGRDGPARHLRLGLGKPLGFGSVTVAVDHDRTDLRDGREWAEAYRLLAAPVSQPAQSSREVSATAVAAFRAEMGGDGFERHPILAAFVAAAEGDPDVPVHYPRVRPQGMDESVPVPPDPQGRGYQWFTKNEKAGEDTEQSLPRAGEGTLPVHQGDRP